MSKPARPAPPEGLADEGRRLWLAVLGDLAPHLELDARERRMLADACRGADAVAALEAAVERDGVTVAGSTGQVALHPAIGEARQQRLAMLRLLSSLDLDDPEALSASPAEARGRKAANARWRQRDEIARRRAG